MHFISEQRLDDGVLERAFTLGEIPGILWTPVAASAPVPLILLGHPPLGLRTMYPRLVARARRSAAEGFAAATIELPGSGDRCCRGSRTIRKLRPPGPPPEAANACRPFPEALPVIQEAAREATRELRAPLQAPRDDDTAPPRGLDHVPELVERASRTGLEATLTIGGQRHDVPAAVGRTVYRIVQESLTNIARHADAGTASVRIDCRPDVLALRIDDAGRATPGPAPKPGVGLPGMRERVTALPIPSTRARPHGASSRSPDASPGAASLLRSGGARLRWPAR
ncbi:sensor histidine kinase [Streptomyces sp. NPDC017936]|uniref:sensor histidine kinase n=1 Tax=Streptomyces sp. NPDC017936 TaxID=3365016 RepID=UPI0037A6D246